jgi:glycosyltransferase involved in cell wall biosynthesis
MTNEQGYPFVHCSPQDVQHYAHSLDIFEELGTTREEQLQRKSKLVWHIETLNVPCGSWLGGIGAALSITGDIGSITRQGFFAYHRSLSTWRCKPMKIAFLTAREPEDRRSWSGIVYCMIQSLRKHCGEVSYIAPMYAPKEEFIGRIINKCTRILFKKRYNYFYGSLMPRRYAKIAAQRLARQDFDVIIAPQAPGEIAYLKTDIPIVFVSDATLPLFFDTYPQVSNLMNISYRNIENLERILAKKATALVYSSSWAAQSIINDFQADPAKVHVVPFGANFDYPPAREVVLQRRKSSSCKLLFVGLQWERKGGEIAFETLLALEKMGIKAELTICGSTPPKQFVHERMHVIPLLDKNDPEQYKRLEQLYLEADFFLLPTRLDSFGIVFCEASAYGLPIITTQTGGVPEVVREGENGFLLPLAARGDEYAKVIASVYQDDERYTRLVRTTRAEYEERLTWDAWGKTMKTILSQVVAERKGHKYDPEQEGQLVASVS